AVMPGLLLGDEAPNFEADTTQGRIRFHDFLGDSWGILFSHPRDFTPVCTTELGRAAKLAPEFRKRNVKMIALSIDSVQDHLSWCKVRALGRPGDSLRSPCGLGGASVTSQSVAVLKFRAGMGKVCSLFMEHPTESRVLF
ncbi:PRDX6 protein, partial [Urocynchramus pylzowi]|nr:PRDX6 protein [Urocynchramus pylzowi]